MPQQVFAGPNQCVPCCFMLWSHHFSSRHPLLGLGFQIQSSLGFRGAALTNSISYWLNVILLFAYVKLWPSCSLAWTGFLRRLFTISSLFLKLAIRSALMVCLKMWSFELLVLLSGLLPNPVLETSVLSICLNTS